MMPLDEAYLEWLYSQVGSTALRDKSTTYWKLLGLLFTKEFTWVIEKDGNRAQDGKDLRTQFLSETRSSASAEWLEQPCSVLELLIGLAFKMAWEVDAKDQADWFWELIANLGLIECTDSNPPEEIILNVIIDKFINREYGKAGNGGLFPIRGSKTDQRKIELWDQLQEYLLQLEII